MVDSLSMTGTRNWRAWPLLLPLAALILLSAISSPSTQAADPAPVLANQPADTPPPGTGATVSATTSATPAASPVVIDEGDDDPDIDKYAFLTIGAAGAAAVIGTIGYLIRRRVGFDPHRPGGGGDSPGDHH